MVWALIHRMGGHITEAEYLELDRASEIKLEYLTGQVYAMAGASQAHNLIVANLIAAIRPQLRGQGCAVYPSDLRVKLPAANYAYPDVTLVCGPAHIETLSGVDTLFNPTVIIEVLSITTRRYDETEKFAYYRAIPTLREYLLIHTRTRWVTQHRLHDGIWQLLDFHTPQAAFDLNAAPCHLSLDAIYDEVLL